MTPALDSEYSSKDNNMSVDDLRDLLARQRDRDQTLYRRKLTL